MAAQSFGDQFSSFDFEEDAFEALKLSEKMMQGHKMDLFLLYLSFIGWIILSALTFGLLLLYVVPYVSQTISVYYQERKAEYLGVTRNQNSFDEAVNKKDDEYYYE